MGTHLSGEAAGAPTCALRVPCPGALRTTTYVKCCRRTRPTTLDLAAEGLRPPRKPRRVKVRPALADDPSDWSTRPWVQQRRHTDGKWMVAWMKIAGWGCAAIVGFVGGISLGGLPGATCVVVSLFVGAVVVGLAVTRLVDLIEARRAAASLRMRAWRRASPKARARCGTCGRKRVSFDGVLVCEACDAIAAALGDIPERIRPD